MTDTPTTSAERMFAALMNDVTCERVAAELEDEDFARRVFSFICGVRGERKNPVTCRQIEGHFPEYSRGAVSDALNTLILDGRVRIMMRSLSSRTRANGGYVYEAVSNRSPHGAGSAGNRNGGETTMATLTQFLRYDDYFRTLCADPTAWPKDGMVLRIAGHERKVLEIRRDCYIYLDSYGSRSLAAVSESDTVEFVRAQRWEKSS